MIHVLSNTNTKSFILIHINPIAIILAAPMPTSLNQLRQHNLAIINVGHRKRLWSATSLANPLHIKHYTGANLFILPLILSPYGLTWFQTGDHIIVDNFCVIFQCMIWNGISHIQYGGVKYFVCTQLTDLPEYMFSELSQSQCNISYNYVNMVFGNGCLSSGQTNRTKDSFSFTRELLPRSSRSC